MPIPFSCQQCGRNLRVRDDLAGMQIYCPDCRVILVVPQANSASQSASEVFETLAPSGSSQDPFQDRLQEARPSGQLPVPAPEGFDDDEWDEAPPPKKRLEPARTATVGYGAVLGGLGLIALSIFVFVIVIALQAFFAVKFAVILFVAGLITFFKGLTSRE